MSKHTHTSTQNSQSQSIQKPIPHELSDLKIAAHAVSIANIDPNKMEQKDPKKRTKYIEKYADYNEELKKQIETNGDKMIGEPKPFYKNNVPSPAGYVIETTNEVIVAYHGTQFGRGDSGKQEIKHDLESKEATMDFGDRTTHLHSGFKAEFDLSKDSLNHILKTVLSKPESKEKGVSFAGHSLGGAVAQIAALDAVQNQGMKVNKVTTLGSPRVFKQDAANLYNEVGLIDKTLRIKNSQDPVPSLPPKAMGYQHTGYKIKISTKAPSALSHPGAQYRKTVTKRIKEEDIAKARPSAPASFKEEYLDPLIKMTKEKFTALVKGIKNPFKSTSQGLKNTKTKLDTKIIEETKNIAKQNNLERFNASNLPVVPLRSTHKIGGGSKTISR